VVRIGVTTLTFAISVFTGSVATAPLIGTYEI
jgi:hypothetical protein